jgi:putative mRNA 3-end processing factor
MARPDVELGPAGMRLSHYPLWLDAPRKQELAFVSHAHGDHIARHARVIATKPTLELMAHRLGKLPEPLAVPYRQAFELGPLTLELFPAGHVLGSAQLRATRDGRRVVYTGDLNVVPSLTAEQTEVAHCDTLVIEATFGHPRFAFPPRAEVLGLLRRFVEQALAEGGTPVVLGYALGKSQEAIAALGEAGLPLCAHASVHAVCNLYRAHGVKLPEVRLFRGEVQPGEVLFLPPNLRRSGALLKLTRPRTVMLTGWAMDPSAPQGRGADLRLPLSDHADFAGLVEYARATGARRVFTVHGFCRELAEALQAQGVEAQPLKSSTQLELF